MKFIPAFFLNLIFAITCLSGQTTPVDLIEGLWPSEFTITGGATVKVQKVDRNGLKDGLYAVVPEKKSKDWEVSLMSTLRTQVGKGDVVYVSFFARSTGQTEAGGTIPFTLIKNSPDWKPLLFSGAEISSEWKRFSAAVKSEKVWDAGDLRIAFLLGGRKQEIELSDLQILRFGPESTVEDAKKFGEAREPSPRKSEGKYSFQGDSERNPLGYKVGEPIVFKIQMLMDGSPAAGINLAWKTIGDDGRTNEGKAVSSTDGPLKIQTSLSTPGFVRVIVTPQDVHGSPLKNGAQKVQPFEGGAGADIEKIQGWKEPEDFDTYWTSQVARLKTVPVQAARVPVDSPDDEVLVWDVKIDCPGKMPVSGYFCKPKNATEKSLPIRITYQGYGVGSALKPVDRKTLTININAHGIENGRTPDFYANLRATTLSNYAFFEDENKNPDTAYFNGMVMRLLRAAEFMKAQPEWDGIHLVVSGGSQGGFQALIIAALDPQVSRCEATIPWCCDLGGVNMGRMPGWRPSWQD
ncbi:MAG: acetylxylan esterase, partial [Spirochaetia bacterium]|nr:acetylxylan esterase [Spirochaetia bacterium]